MAVALHHTVLGAVGPEPHACAPAVAEENPACNVGRKT